MSHRVTEKYLGRYAEPEALLPIEKLAHWHFSLVIPAYRESAENIRRTWRNIRAYQQFLVILVINAPDQVDPETSEQADRLLADGKLTRISDDTVLLQKPGNPDCLIVDRYSESHTIPAKLGVGLARKIGCDIALHLHHEGIIKSDWLFTTDADAILPAGYFYATSSAEACARLYPFSHTLAPPLALAVKLYEIYLLYYAAALANAGSPYAFPTIGSTISCRAESYAAVRGFPRRSTGEDFYLLNKLSKLGHVLMVDSDPIMLEGRASKRVPVGTGQTVLSISEMDNPLEDYSYENPACFVALKALLDDLSLAADQRLPSLNSPDKAIQDYCETSGLGRHYNNLRKQNLSPSVVEKSLMDWFDGLRTRQFIRQMRDKHFGTLTIKALASTPLIDIVWRDTSSLDDITAHLRRQVFQATTPPL